MLIGNYSVISKSPGQFYGGTTVSGDRANFDKSGSNRNRWIGLFDQRSGLPSGHLPPSAWILPIIAGGLSSFNYATVTITGAANGAAGVNMVGDTSLTITADALGQLIASALGSADIAITADGSIVATLGAPGSASFLIDASGTTTALANASGTASLVIDASLVSYATGSMSGLAYLAGNAVASDLDEVIEGDLTARQVLRVLLAGISGRTSGIGTSTETYLGTDGTTPRIVTTFDSDSNRVTVALDGD